MGKHTEGPWKLPANSRVVYADDDMETPVAEVFRTPDARLIAAAPELLEALRDVLASACEHPSELDGEGQAALNKAQAAIAKATGEQA